MKNALENKYVVYINDSYASGLKINVNGDCDFIDITNETFSLIREYPTLDSSIQEGKLVQATNVDGNIVIVVGNHIYEGTYNETEGLDVIAKASSEDLITALGLIDSELSKSGRVNTVRQRLYRPYNKDCFK